MSFWNQYPDLTFEERTHTYIWREKKVLSVTQLFDMIGFRKDNTKPFNSIGLPDVAKKENNAIFGSEFHKGANGIVQGLNVTWPIEMIPWANTFEIFWKESDFIPIIDRNCHPLSEYPMFSKRFGFAGTPDLICRNKRDNNIYIIDWKTSTSYQDCFSWQTAAYEQLFRELFGGWLFDHREKIVRATYIFSPTEVKSYKRHCKPQDWIFFQSLLNIYKKLK